MPASMPTLAGQLTLGLHIVGEVLDAETRFVPRKDSQGNQTGTRPIAAYTVFDKGLAQVLSLQVWDTNCDTGLVGSVVHFQAKGGIQDYRGKLQISVAVVGVVDASAT